MKTMWVSIFELRIVQRRWSEWYTLRIAGIPPFFPGKRENKGAAFLIGATIKVKLKASKHDSTSQILFFGPNEERSTK
jgi:hypothetical protein